MVRARGTRIGGRIYGLERQCQGRNVVQVQGQQCVYPDPPAACKVRPAGDEPARLRGRRRL